MNGFKALFFDNFSRYRSVLMGIAMLSIMLSHQRFVHVFPFNVFESYGHWGVDIFLFLSGIGMVRSLATHSVSEFYHRRFNRLVPICVFCGALKYLLYLLIGSPIENLKVGLNIGPWSVFSLDLWFIHSIVIYYLLSPLLYRILKSLPVSALSLSILCAIIMHYFFADAVGFDWLNPLGIMLYTVDRLPVFMMGMLVTMYEEKVMGSHFVLSAGAFLTVLVVSVLLKTHLIPQGFYAVVYPLLALGIFSVLAGLIALLLHVSSRVLAPFGFVGKHSLEIYLVHEFIFASFLLTMYTKCNHALLLTVTILLSFLVAWCCRRCTDKIMSFFPYTH